MTTSGTQGRFVSPEEPVSQLRRVPIRECGEAMYRVDEVCPSIWWVAEHPVFSYERSKWARLTVLQMLERASGLLPSGMRLGLVEAWRHPGIQAAMYAASRKRIEAEFPHWTRSQITRRVNRFSAPPDPRVPPPHTTGGAVDVTLIREDGFPVDFTSPYDPFDPAGALSRAKGLGSEASSNRELLWSVMGEVGFTNYPAEWWHWSFGDPGWAYRGGHESAIYGGCAPEDASGAAPEFTVRSAPVWQP